MKFKLDTVDFSYSSDEGKQLEVLGFKFEKKRK